MKVTFNLKKANYDGGRGLIQTQTRNWSNCQKAKMESGMGAQEAWNSCLKEYQTMSGGEWAGKYAAHESKKEEGK